MEAQRQPEENSSHLATVLLAHEKARARAWAGKNRQALDVLLAPEYVEINMLGRFSKNEVLGRLLDAIILHACDIQEPVLVFSGPEPAILTYRCRGDMTINNQRTSGMFHVSAHYALRGNTWKLLLWQITPWTAP